MSQHRPILCLPLTASSAVKEHHCVKAGGAQASTAGERVLGVAEYAAKSGEQVSVIALGTAIAAAGGTFAVGDQLQANGDGEVIKHTSTNAVLGVALEAGSDGKRVEVLLTP